MCFLHHDECPRRKNVHMAFSLSSTTKGNNAELGGKMIKVTEDTSNNPVQMEYAGTPLRCNYQAH